MSYGEGGNGRHPAAVTAARLGDALTHFKDFMSSDERETLASAQAVLEEIAAGKRKFVKLTAAAAARSRLRPYVPPPPLGPWSDRPDEQGYWTTRDGRWKAREHRDGVTLTDTTRRTTFADTNASWTRLPDWDWAENVIEAHRTAERAS